MLGERIKSCRKRMKISQIKLAEYLSVSQAAITAWEREQRKPDVDMILKMADFFDVSTDYLLGREPSLPTDTDTPPAGERACANVMTMTPELKAEIEEIVQKSLKKYLTHKR